MGLRTIEEYLEILERMYPNVPYAEIKKWEKRIFNETDLKIKLDSLDRKYATQTTRPARP